MSPSGADAPHPPHLTRRKLLLAAGFGAANIALLRAIGPTIAATQEPEGTAIRVVGERAAPTGPPSLEGAAPPPPADEA